MDGIGQFLNSEKTFNNSDEHNLTSVNFTAKIARKIRLVLEMLKPPSVELKLVEQIGPLHDPVTKKIPAMEDLWSGQRGFSLVIASSQLTFITEKQTRLRKPLERR